MNLLTGPVSQEAMSYLFNDVPRVDPNGQYIADPQPVDMLYMDVTDATIGARAAPGADPIVVDQRLRRVRAQVQTATRASAIRGGLARYLLSEFQPSKITDLTATDISIDVGSPIGGAGSLTVRAQYSFMSVGRPWFDTEFLKSSDWFWPAHRQYSLAGTHTGLMEAISVQALLLWTVVAVGADATSLEVLLSPPWSVFGYRTEIVPPSPSVSDPGLT